MTVVSVEALKKLKMVQIKLELRQTLVFFEPNPNNLLEILFIRAFLVDCLVCKKFLPFFVSLHEELLDFLPEPP